MKFRALDFDYDAEAAALAAAAACSTTHSDERSLDDGAVLHDVVVVPCGVYERDRLWQQRNEAKHKRSQKRPRLANENDQAEKYGTNPSGQMILTQQGTNAPGNDGELQTLEVMMNDGDQESTVIHPESSIYHLKESTVVGTNAVRMNRDAHTPAGKSFLLLSLHSKEPLEESSGFLRSETLDLPTLAAMTNHRVEEKMELYWFTIQRLLESIRTRASTLRLTNVPWHDGLRALCRPPEMPRAKLYTAPGYYYYCRPAAAAAAAKDPRYSIPHAILVGQSSSSIRSAWSDDDLVFQHLGHTLRLDRTTATPSSPKPSAAVIVFGWLALMRGQHTFGPHRVYRPPPAAPPPTVAMAETAIVPYIAPGPPGSSSSSLFGTRDCLSLAVQIALAALQSPGSAVATTTSTRRARRPPTPPPPAHDVVATSSSWNLDGAWNLPSDSCTYDDDDAYDDDDGMGAVQQVEEVVDDDDEEHWPEESSQDFDFSPIQAWPPPVKQRRDEDDHDDKDVEDRAAKKKTKKEKKKNKKRRREEKKRNQKEQNPPPDHKDQREPKKARKAKKRLGTQQQEANADSNAIDEKKKKKTKSSRPREANSSKNNKRRCLSERTAGDHDDDDDDIKNGGQPGIALNAAAAVAAVGPHRSGKHATEASRKPRWVEGPRLTLGSAPIPPLSQAERPSWAGAGRGGISGSTMHARSFFELSLVSTTDGNAARPPPSSAAAAHEQHRYTNAVGSSVSTRSETPQDHSSGRPIGEAPQDARAKDLSKERTIDGAAIKSQNGRPTKPPVLHEPPSREHILIAKHPLLARRSGNVNEPTTSHVTASNTDTISESPGTPPVAKQSVGDINQIPQRRPAATTNRLAVARFEPIDENASITQGGTVHHGNSSDNKPMVSATAHPHRRDLIDGRSQPLRGQQLSGPLAQNPSQCKTPTIFNAFRKNIGGRNPVKPQAKGPSVAIQLAGTHQTNNTSVLRGHTAQLPAFSINDATQETEEKRATYYKWSVEKPPAAVQARSSNLLSQGQADLTQAFVVDHERVDDRNAESRQDCPSTPPPVHVKNQVGPTQDPNTSTPTVRCLCSESFLESRAEIVAQLASGTWGSNTTEASSTSWIVGLVDTPLLDRCKVDIETPDQRGIVILNASQLGTPETAKDTILFLVELAALRRYDRITVFILLDDPTSDALPVYLAKIHCAMAGQHEQHGPSKIAVIPIPFDNVASAVAKLVRLAARKASPEQVSLDNQATELVATSNSLAIERSFFLLNLVPSLSAYGALQSLLLADQLVGGGNPGAAGFAALLTNKMLRQQIILTVSSRQLGMGINPSAMTHLSRLVQAQL